jgi:Flp pilus assembly protein TadB
MTKKEAMRRNKAARHNARKGQKRGESMPEVIRRMVKAGAQTPAFLRVHGIETDEPVIVGTGVFAGIGEE